jgi:hypothetical protein
VLSRKFQGGPSSVPKQKKNAKKSFKEVPQVCPNKDNMSENISKEYLKGA